MHNHTVNSYEPDQDSFLFLDALEAEFSYLKELHPQIILEIGPGSGILSSFLSRLVSNQNDCLTIGIDINMEACLVTDRTYNANNVRHGCVIRSNLLQGTLPRLENTVDVLLFNPPYVPTSSKEVFLPSIESAYAGGIHGREVIDKLLPMVSKVLSEKGVFYLLLEHNNHPDEVNAILSSYGLHHQMILKKQCRGEELYIMKYYR